MPGKQIDVPRIRATVDRAFAPRTLDNLTGKSVLWVDDNPSNNELAMRALRKFNLDVEQATSTDTALAAMQRRPFDLVISDMGRGADLSYSEIMVAMSHSSFSQDQTRLSFVARRLSVEPNFRQMICWN
jgi:ActR/RegA family two-component response regulator